MFVSRDVSTHALVAARRTKHQRPLRQLVPRVFSPAIRAGYRRNAYLQRMQPQASTRRHRKRFFWRRVAALTLLALFAGSLGMIAARSSIGRGEPIAAATTPPADSEAAEPEDRTPPQIEIKKPTKNLDPFAPIRLTGEVDEPVVLKIERRKQRVPAGRFRVRLEAPPRMPIAVVARDAAGNETETQIEFDIKWPPMRAVHVSGYAWATPSFREALIKMIDRRLINTIQLDLKDESGVISYRSNIPLAQKIRSSYAIYELKEALRILHKKKVRVVGRIVCFRDAILAKASWPKYKERVIQNPDGSAYANYGGFTNFADPTVREYNIAVAEEAARAGIDDILYDYVRRPDGPLENLRMPGLKETPERAIVRFVRETKNRLAPYGTRLGLSVYGIAATRPKEIAQDIPRLARHSDYISPMVYPSHWASGEYNVANPNAEPYKIVHRSLKDFLKQTRKTDASVIPWLQDFSLGTTYGAQQLRAQIEATYDRGIKEWILWDPHVTYTTSALDPITKKKSTTRRSR